MASKTSRLSRSVVVIGLGRFGRSLALEMIAGDAEVLGIDSSDHVVQAVAGRLTHAAAADSTDVEALRQLSVHEFKRAVVGIGTDLEASILTTSILVDFGIPHIWAKAVSESHARILRKVGAHHVVRPEHDMGRRVAHLVRGKMEEYIEFEDGYTMVRTSPPSFMWNVPLGQCSPRTKHRVTIVGVKSLGSGFSHATPDTVVNRGDTIIVSGERNDVERFSTLE